MSSQLPRARGTAAKAVPIPAAIVNRDRERDSRLAQQAIAAAKAGDPEAIHFLYVRFSPDVLRYVDSFVSDHHEAEAITQSVFAKLAKAIGGYELRGVPFAVWILEVARDTALDQMRARALDPSSVGL